jgi:hypothetical protein
MDQLVNAVVGFGAAGVLFAVFWFVRRKDCARAAAMRDAALRTQLAYSAKDTQRTLKLKFFMFSWRPARKIKNVLSGTVHGVPVRLFDYTFQISAQHDPETWSCALVDVPSVPGQLLVTVDEGKSHDYGLARAQPPFTGWMVAGADPRSAAMLGSKLVPALEPVRGAAPYVELQGGKLFIAVPALDPRRVEFLLDTVVRLWAGLAAEARRAAHA